MASIQFAQGFRTYKT